MATLGSDKSQEATVNKNNPDSKGDFGQVVMRKPRNQNVFSKDSNEDAKNIGDDKNTKHVKWSESTELRERLKICRRSQLDIPLDYHHYPIEEEREREGVKVWRTLLHNKEKDDEDLDVSIPGGSERQGDAVTESTNREAENVTKGPDVSGDRSSLDFDSDEDDPNYNEDLERQLQLIKEETTKYTLYPAYKAAISVYEDWLSNAEHTEGLTQDQVTKMRSQLSLYKRLVDIYKDWTEQKEAEGNRVSRFGEITSILQEVSNLGQPPACVAKTISEALADEDNVQKQVEAYNSLVQEMLSKLDITTKV